MRFSEALAITPEDFDFVHQTLSVSKTWDYKGEGGFLPTKNKSTVNDVLTGHCKAAGIPIISLHGLRHTHASLLLFAGVSIASVARRLGHASMTTTQKTYLHIIQELENKDVYADFIANSLLVP